MQGAMGRDRLTPGRDLSPERVKNLWALKRFPDYNEIANVILFLASEEATFTTGTEITCDGGATIGPRYLSV
jgi:NAD(P)-dependent dehydrogenase (short-subunit alcohol dehydrogenase family)